MRPSLVAFFCRLLVGFVLTVQVGLVQLRNYDVDEHSEMLLSFV